MRQRSDRFLFIKKTSAFFLLLCIGGVHLSAQQRVANYSTGEPGTSGYEEFSFWTNNGIADSVIYAYGAEPHSMKLSFTADNNLHRLLVTFSNNYSLTIVPDSTILHITDTLSNYNKTFYWEYEGPVNGIGTFCSICADGEQEAMEIVMLFIAKNN